jgi:hypothetical protein
MTSDASIVRGTPDEPHHLETKDRVGRDLERHGYVADPYATDAGGGALYRHAVAPSLIVHDDGRIELPSGQRTAQSLLPAQLERKRIRWRRALPFLALLCAAIFLGLIATALIVG